MPFRSLTIYQHLKRDLGGGEFAEALRIHQALKEVDCAMFEDAEITAVLGTVLRGEEAEQREESSAHS